jgi:hypothetical protein
LPSKLIDFHPFARHSTRARRFNRYVNLRPFE